MAGRSAIVAGASGLTGGLLTNMLLDSSDFTKVTIIGRKNLPLSHPKLDQVIVDFEHLDSTLPSYSYSDAFCCLGTTRKKAGSREAFEKVDYTFVLNVAVAVQKMGTKYFSFISSMGADPASTFFYNRVKGDTENALISLNFPSLVILRPSLLLGERDEIRSGEKLAQRIFRVIGPLFIGPLKKYRGIEASRVARCMLEQSGAITNGTRIIESEEISRLTE